MNKKAAGVLLTGAAVLVGFMIGFGVGQRTRTAAASNVKTSYNGGTVTIEADITGALQTGVKDYLGGLAG